MTTQELLAKMDKTLEEVNQWECERRWLDAIVLADIRFQLREKAIVGGAVRLMRGF